MMPAPCTAFIWNIIDIAVCRFFVLTPVYTVSSSCILVVFYLVMCIMTGLFYS